MIATSAEKAEQSGFQIVDDGKSRSDLLSRTELKFTLPNSDLGKIRKLLSGTCRAVSHNRRVSEVYSLYFDDAQLSACHANIDGLGLRSKLRLRWYDTKQAPANFFLEVKWRNNRVTGKHRFQVQSDTPLYQLPLREIYRRVAEVAPKEQAREVLRYCDPIVIVSYQREHFVAPDPALRLTLDYDLKFYDQVGRRSMRMSFPTKFHDMALIEGKTPIGREQELRALLRPLTPRADRCSKYVHGCRMLGHVKVGE